MHLSFRCFVLILASLLCSVPVSAKELLFFDDFEDYADTAALEKVYLITRVGVEMPRLSNGIAAGGGKALYLFCNGRAGKIRLPRVIGPAEAFDLEFDLMFTPKFSEGIGVFGGDETLNWNSQAFGIANLNSKYALEKWSHIRIGFAPAQEGRRTVRLYVNGKLESESEQEASKGNQTIEYFRFGVNGDGGRIYIDNIAVRSGQDDDGTAADSRTGHGLANLPIVLQNHAHDATDHAKVLTMDVDGDGQNEPVLLNGNVVLALQPQHGGRGIYLAFRQNPKNLAGVDGLMRDFFWKESYINQPICELPYRWKAGSDAGGAYVTLNVKGQTGFYKYLSIERTVYLGHSDSTFHVKTTYHNDPNSVGVLTLTPWFHNEIGFSPESNEFHYFSQNGRQDVLQKSIASEHFWKDPMKNYYAISSPEGTAVCAFDYPYLQSLYTWSGNFVVPTFEWRLFPVTIPQDERFIFSYELTLLPGKVVPDGVGRNGEVVTLSCTAASDKIAVQSSLLNHAGEAEVRITSKPIFPASKEKEREVFRGKLQSGQPAEVYWNNSKALLLTAEYLDAHGNVIASGQRLLAQPGVLADYTYPPQGPRMKVEEKTYSRLMDDAYMEHLDFSTVTPHFPWAKPIAGKKLKALVLTPAMGMREIVELAQRFPMDVETVYINQGPAFINGDFFGVDMDPKSIQVLRKKLAKDYDVIILGGLDIGRYLPGEMSRQLLDSVRSGTGLVCISGSNFPESWKTAFDGRTARRVVNLACPELTEEGKTHCLTQGFSPELLGRISTIGHHTKGALMKAGENNCAAAVTLGKGRVFFIEYHNETQYYGHTGGGLTQYTPDIFSSGSRWDFDYQEYSLMLAGRAAFWAAGRDGDFHTLTRLEATGPRNLRIAWQNGIGAAPAVKVTGELSDCFGQVITRFEQPSNGSNDVSISLARPFVGGINRLKCQLWDKDGNVVGFGAAQYETEGLPQFGTVETEEFESGLLHGKVTVTGNTEGTRLHLALKDGYGRLAAEETLPFQSDFTLSLDRMASHFGSLNLSLADQSGNTLAVARIPVARKDTASYRKWTTFRLIICGLLRRFCARNYLLPYYYEKFHEMGCKYLADDVPDTSGRLFGFDMLMHSLGGMAERWGDMTYWKENFDKTNDKTFLMRKRDFDNHEFLDSSVKKMTKELTRCSNAQANWIMVDEDEYSMPGLDFDFSPASLAAFRHYLHGEYGTLDALNTEWGTAFAKWDDVEPSTCKDIRKRTDGNFSSWADHRTFNTITVNKAWTFYREMLNRNAPGTLMAQSGTRPTLAYGGNDWYLLMNTFTFMLPYSLYKQQYAYQTGFSKIPIAPWLGGYGNTNMDELYFNTMRCGRLGLSVYAGESMLSADFSRLTDTAETVRQAMYYPLRGRGELMHKAEREEEVAVYFSVPSYQAAWITGNEQLHDVNWKGYVQLLEDMNVGYTFLASQQIKGGELCRRKPKLLILPLVYALSQAEVQEIQAYVAEGGNVLMDASAGVMDGHCRTLEKSILGCAFFKDAWRNSPLADKPRVVQLGDRRLKLTQTTEEESLLFKPCGKGTITLLHGLFSGDYAYFSQNRIQAEMRSHQWEILDFMGDFLDRCQVRRIVRTPVGKQQLSLSAVGYRENQNRYLLIRPLQGTKNYEINTGDRLVWFNTHTGECLGNGPELKASLKGTTILAGMPRDCGAPAMTLSRRELMPGDALNITVRTPVSPETRQVWCVEVFNPDGKSVPAYLNTFDSPNGTETACTLHFALNDSCGEWTVTVTDAATGRQATEKVTIKAPSTVPAAK